MEALAGPFAAAAALLALGGAPKVRRPGSTARALRAVGLPSATVLVRALGVAEVLIGAGALTLGTAPFAWLVAASYAGFTAFVALALRRGTAVDSCGCFGRPDTPATASHLLVTDGFAVIAGAAVTRPPGGLLAALLDTPAVGGVLLLFAALCTWFAHLALTAVPRLTAAAQRRPAPTPRSSSA